MAFCTQCGSTLSEPVPPQCPRCGSLLTEQATTQTIVPFDPRQPASEDERKPTDHHALDTGGLERPPDPPLAWDERDRIGWASAFVETTRQILTGPTAFFRRMPVAGGLGGPLLYAVLAGWSGLAAAAFYQAIWISIVGPATLPFGLDRPELAQALAWFESWAGLVAQLVFGGISVTIGVFVAAGLLHLMLMLLGGARSGFEATFRVVCFSQATTLLLVIPLFLIPFCGLLGVVWCLVLYVIGLAAAHRIGQGTALAAVLLPLVALCCCCGAFAFTLVGAIAGLARHAG